MKAVAAAGSSEMIEKNWCCLYKFNFHPRTNPLSCNTRKSTELKYRLGICQKIYTTKFSDERILHTENALIETFFARDKQRKCIIISNLALFWLKLNSYYESLHLGVCKLAKYVRNCVVFWKNLHS